MRFCSKCCSTPELIEVDSTAWGIKTTDHRVYYYQCHKCGFQTAAAISGYNDLYQETITEDHARHIALEFWNNQYTAEDMIREATERGRQLRKEGVI